VTSRKDERTSEKPLINKGYVFPKSFYYFIIIARVGEYVIHPIFWVKKLYFNAENKTQADLSW